MLVTPQSILSIVELLTVFIITSIFVYYLYYQYCFTYWKKKGLPTLSPSFPLGDLSTSALGVESTYIRIQNIYNEFKARGHKVGGIYYFNGPVVLPVDPDLIKSIMVTNFDHFVDRGSYISEHVPLTLHMFSMKGEQWRTLRAKFSPTFTSGRMKSMYNILVKQFENLVEVIDPIAQNEETVDIKTYLMRTTTDIIGTVAFGIDVNSLTHPDTEFARMANKIFSPPKWRLLKLVLEEGLQNPANIIKIASEDKLVEDYFTGVVKKTVEYRDKNNIVRDDFLNVLMELRKTGMSLTEVVAEAFLFFTAGYETSSSTMSYCIHELAHNQEVQDQIREEIHEKLGRDPSKYTYEDVLSLPSLDRAVKETLRKYPPVPVINRKCVKPYKIPGTETVIDVGTPLIVSVLGLHRDPDYFPNPLEFNPERFNGENKIKPFTYLPFGDGPRNCIGLRFGLMQTKLGLCFLLNDYKFLPSPKSPRDLVIDPSTTVLVLTVLNGVYTKIVKV